MRGAKKRGEFIQKLTERKKKKNNSDGIQGLGGVGWGVKVSGNQEGWPGVENKLTKETS